MAATQSGLTRKAGDLGGYLAADALKQGASAVSQALLSGVGATGAMAAGSFVGKAAVVAGGVATAATIIIAVAGVASAGLGLYKIYRWRLHS